MRLTKSLFSGLLLCLAQFAPVAAQTPSSVPPLYSREEIDAKIDAIQNEINALKAVDPYSRTDIDTKLEGIRSDLKALQAINPYSKSETDAKLDALEKTTAAKINALRQEQDDTVKALTEKANAIPFWLPIAVSIFSALLAAFTLWRTSANRPADRALSPTRDADLTFAAKPVKRSSIRYGWFG
jgi:hypothetical protein